MEYKDSNHNELQKNIDKLTLNEKYRKEKHDSSRIIFNSEISPVQMYQNLMDNTVFTYKNKVPEEGSKVITRLKTIRKNKIIGSIIQLIGVLLIVLFVLFVLNPESVALDDNIKLAFGIAVFAGIPLFLLTGAIIRASGRKLMGEYLEVWNKASILKAPIEINCLKNGQLAIVKYRHRDKSCGEYLSALNPDDTVWHGNFLSRIRIPTYVEYIYIIDSIKSCAETENGLMIESAGRCYGNRWAMRKNNGKGNGTWFSVFAETHISYRKEEIPAILDNMEQLETSLLNYGCFEPGRNAFSPLC